MDNIKEKPITQRYLDKKFDDFGKTVDKKFDDFGKTVDKKFDDFALLVKKGFDNTATKDELKQLATKDELLAVEARLNKKVNNLNEQVSHYLELSDDRYLEIKGRLKTHEQWFNLIAKELQLEFKAQN